MKPNTLKKLITLLVTLIYAFIITGDFLWIIEYRMQDAAFQNARLTHPDIFIVAIDQPTLDELGAFGTWSRNVMAQVLTILNSDPDFRPAVIAVDILYVDPSTPGLDNALANSVRDTDNILLASNLFIGPDPANMIVHDVILDYVRPISPLLPYVSTGFINGTFDNDGFARSASLVTPFEGGSLYSFPVMAASMFLGQAPSEIIPPDTLDTIISYSGQPGDYWGISLIDILHPDFDPIWFADSIVLIGPYATGMMDHHPVPITPNEAMFGVEIHANVIAQILDGIFINRIEAPKTYFITITLLVVVMAIGEFSKLRYSMILSFLLLPIYYVGAIYLYYTGHFVPIFSPLLAVVFGILYQIIYSYALNSLEKNRMRNTFKKYVDPKLVDVLIQNKEASGDEVGQKKHISVMFIDVRGFTPLTESLGDHPERIVEILNSYLEITSSAIFDNGGSVDKFIGDATMALFNGFVPLEDYVYKSVKSAWDIVQKADAFNATIKEKYGLDVGFGIGIHCGEAIVGNLGPSFRKDYTAIGDTVNTAARLESNAKASQVLISEDVYLRLRDRIIAESVGAVPLKGKSKPMELYSLIGIK